jgi:hypothetical protein
VRENRWDSVTFVRVGEKLPKPFLAELRADRIADVLADAFEFVPQFAGCLIGSGLI